MFPRAYFLTWSCYGARLHGDPRGTVDRAHNAYLSPRLAPSQTDENRARAQMSEEPYLLCDKSREVVHQTILDHIRHRCWELLACNVRTNHVHVVLSARIDPESVMGQLKAWSSRRLREAGLLAAGRTKLWTPHGSTKYLWDIEDTREAVHYVRNLQ